MENQNLTRDEINEFFKLKEKIENQCIYLLEQITGKKNLIQYDREFYYEENKHIEVEILVPYFRGEQEQLAYGIFSKEDLAFPVLRINKEKIKGK